MDKNKIELTGCDSGDWEVLKLNGEVYDDGHGIATHTWLKLLKELGNEVIETTVTDEDMEEGKF